MCKIVPIATPKRKNRDFLSAQVPGGEFFHDGMDSPVTAADAHRNAESKDAAKHSCIGLGILECFHGLYS
jgi:hypothetical protein